MKEFVADEATDLKTFTDGHFPQGSFAFAALLRAKDIKVNGVRVNKNVRLKAGDRVVYYTTPAQEQKASHRVIYADRSVVVCDKFSGVSTEGLLAELQGGGETFAVHRLDRNTEGVIVFARTRAAEEELLRAFREHAVQKTYLALCKDSFKGDAAVLTAYLKKDEARARVEISDRPCDGYVKIVTQYKVLERSGELALAQIELHTGKTHQIRAHMAHIGCPILGDEKYGDGDLNKKYGARRQRLVSKCVSFELHGKLAYLSGRIFESAFVPRA